MSDSAILVIYLHRRALTKVKQLGYLVGMIFKVTQTKPEKNEKLITAWLV